MKYLQKKKKRTLLIGQLILKINSLMKNEIGQMIVSINK